MAEIIDFSAFKKEKEKETKTEIKPEKKKIKKEKICYEKLAELLIMVAGLISKNKGEQFRKLYYDKYFSASSFSDAEIMEKINDFDEKDVVADPIFYFALIDVSRDRELRVQK
ncbi:MAG: hypothetical protein V1667_02260 [bacterium]